MTDWTKEDTEELRNVAQNVTYRGFKAELEIEHRAAAHIESLEARVAELEAREDERAALLSQAISHAREMEARHEKTTSHTLELYAMLSQRNARIATLEATNAEQARRLEEIIGRENRWDEYERTGVWPERFNLGMYFDVRRLDGYWQKLVMEHDAAKTRIAVLEAEQSAMLASHLRRMVDIATERNKAEGVIREWAAAERGKYSDGGLCVPDEAYERWTKATEALLALAARLERDAKPAGTFPPKPKEGT